MAQQIVKGDFSSKFSSSCYCSINPNRTGNFSLLSLQTVSAQQAPLPVPVKPFPNKTRNLSLLPDQTVSAKQGLLPGQVAVCRHRTVTPNPVLVNPESFMETSRSAGALWQGVLVNFCSFIVMGNFLQLYFFQLFFFNLSKKQSSF